jgi:hypothetical protein
MKSLYTSLSAIVLLCVFSLSLHAQAATQTLYLPVLQATNSGDLGLALSNPTLSAVTVTLTARDYTGAVISGTGITNPATINIPATGQRALRTVEIFGTGMTGKVGWVELLSSSVAIKGFFLLFDSAVTFIDGASLQTAPASRLVFPKVSGNPASPTMISYVNTGTGSLQQCALTLYDNTGRLAARTLLTLTPKSGFTGSILDVLPAAAGIEGYAVLESTGTPSSGLVSALVGFETYRNKTDIAALNAVPDTALSTISYLPHFASGGGYVTRLALVNFTNQSQTLTITAGSIQKDGVNQTPSTAVAIRTIPPNGRLEETADSLFGLTGSSLYTGYIEWQTQGSTNGVIGYLDYGTTDGVLLSAVTAQSTGYSDLFFSHIAQGLGYYTGIAFLNANAQTSVVNIDAFDQTGNGIASTTLTLPAGQRTSKLFTELFPVLGTQLGGYVHVSASRPIFAFELFGSSASLSFLANVAAEGVQLPPQASGGIVTAAIGANLISADSSSSISIPPGALSSDTAVSLNSVTVTLPPPSSTQQVVASVDAEPTGTVFNIPVRLTFPLSVQLTPGTQVPVLIYTAQGAYQNSGFTAIVDASGRTASAEVTHFTTYAVGLSADQIISVTSISPTSGVAGTTSTPGTVVMISGSGFSATASNNIVTFAGTDNSSVTAAVTAATPTALTLTVPANAITGNVIVTVGTSTSTGILFTVPGYRDTPSLSSISPASLPAGTTAAEIKVAGTHFLNASVVRIDGTAVTTTFVNPTLLLADISGAQIVPGVHRVTVFTPTQTGGSGGGESVTNDISNQLTIGFPVPAITGIVPTTAAAGNGPVTVTITGTGFNSSTAVTVNGVNAGGIFVNSTTMTVVLNSARAGDFPIVVSNPPPAGGSSGTTVFSFSDSTVGAINLLSTANLTGTVGTTVTIQVQVLTKSGAILAGYPVTFFMVAGNGAVSPGATTTDAQGHASATITLGISAGTNTVSVSSGGVAVNFSVTGTAGAATKIGLSASPGSIAVGGAGATITAQIQDQYGNLRGDAVNVIAFSVSGNGGNLSATSVTAVAGVATTTLTSTSAGTTTVQASAAGLTSGTANVTVTSGGPALLTATGGNNQTVAPGISLLTPLMVHVTDAGGGAVPSVTVNWAATSGGGSVSAPTSMTNSNGDATISATVGPGTGTNTFTATVSGIAPVTFTATSKVLTTVPTSIDVLISSGATSVGAYQVTIMYDATKLRLSSSNVVGPGTGVAGTPATININPAGGAVTINNFSTSGLAGTFPVARLTFTPIRPGTATLSTGGVTVADQSGNNVSSGFLSIVATGTTTPAVTSMTIN